MSRRELLYKLFKKEERDVFVTNPSGPYVLNLLEELKRLDCLDNIEEDRLLLIGALRKGHLFYSVMPSRVTNVENPKKMYYRIVPVVFDIQVDNGLSWLNMEAVR